MIQIIAVIFRAIAVVFAADLFTGFIHWLEDTFWTEETPIVGKWLIQPNELHHRKPAAFLAKNWWQSSYDAILVGIVILFIAYLMHHLDWSIWLFVLISMNATQIHKFAHQPRSRIPPFVWFLQKIRVIQNCHHHVKHHRGHNDSHYCLITPLLNPVLDRIHFWRILEIILKPILGKSRR